MPEIKVGDRVMFKREKRHREYPARQIKPRPVDEVWIVNDLSDSHSEWFDYPRNGGVANLRLARDPSIELTCFTGRLENSFLVQVKLAYEKGMNAERTTTETEA